MKDFKGVNNIKYYYPDAETHNGQGNSGKLGDKKIPNLYPFLTAPMGLQFHVCKLQQNCEYQVPQKSNILT